MKIVIKIIRFIATLAIGAVSGIYYITKLKNKDLDRISKKVNKFRGYYNVLNQWMLLKNQGKSLTEYFNDNGYTSIAIYGMGEVGNRLYEELKNSEIEVKYAIDKSAGSAYAELSVYDPEDEFDTVDTIVVTAVFDFDEIEKDLIKKTDIPVISLEEVVFGIRV